MTRHLLSDADLSPAEQGQILSLAVECKKDRLGRQPLLGKSVLESVIVAAYSDYLRRPTTLAVPEFIAAPRLEYRYVGHESVDRQA